LPLLYFRFVSVLLSRGTGTRTAVLLFLFLAPKDAQQSTDSRTDAKRSKDSIFRQ
jgi:hypothetical protein